MFTILRHVSDVSPPIQRRILYIESLSSSELFSGDTKSVKRVESRQSDRENNYCE